MKKIISLCICFIMLWGMFTTSSANEAQTRQDKSFFRLRALGIMDDDVDAETPVTRGDAVKYILPSVAGNVGELGFSETGFLDVPTDHKAAPYIAHARNMGMVVGDGTGTFMPDDTVTLHQFLKMAAFVMGYDAVALQQGGYPSGYMTVAANERWLRNVSVEDGAGLKAKDVWGILDNLLEAYPMETVYGSMEMTRGEKTLHELLLERNGMEFLRAKITAVGKSALNGHRPLRDEEFSVGALVLQSDGKVKYDMLGKDVSLYYIKENGTNATVKDIWQESINNEMLFAADDLTELTTGTAKYYDAQSEKTERISADASFFYNGRLKTFEEGVDISPQTGTVRILDNNGDNVYDAVFIEEYKSIVVDRVSETNSTLYFKKDMLFNDKPFFAFDFTDTSIIYKIEDAEGNEMQFSDIKSGDVVSIQASPDEEEIFVIVSDLRAAGVVNQISPAEKIVTVSGSDYAVYEENESEIFRRIRVGMESIFLLNHRDEIVDMEGGVAADGEYGYVIGAQKEGSIISSMKLRVVHAGSSEKIVETNNGVETIKYTYANGEIKDLQLADRVQFRVHPAEVYKSVSAAEISEAYLSRAAISYRLNSDGKINRLSVSNLPVYDIAKRSDMYAYSFNGKLNSFGGYSSKKAFYVSENTEMLLVPSANNPIEEDFGVDVTITSANTYTVVPIDFDEKTQIASCAVLIEPMDSSTAKPFADNIKMSIIGKVSEGMDENGYTIYNVEALTGDKVQTLQVAYGSIAADVAPTLSTGDLVYYNTRSSGEIDNMKYIESISRLGSEYFLTRENSSEEVAYGMADEIEMYRLDDLKNEIVHILSINTGTRIKSYPLSDEDGPVFYMYRRRNGAIYRAGVEDIGAGVTEVFMFVDQNEPKAVIIIKD